VNRVGRAHGAEAVLADANGIDCPAHARALRNGPRADVQGSLSGISAPVGVIERWLARRNVPTRIRAVAWVGAPQGG